MPDADRPQLYLVTPPAFDPDSFADRLAQVLDGAEVACLRLAMAGSDLDAIRRAADTCRAIAHARDVAVVIQTHARLVQPLGLDGVHLTDGARSLRTIRKDIGPDAILGAHCGTTRHEGISAAEIGVDYVAFGPVGASPLGNGRIADPDLFDWWSEMIEIPVVSEGALTQDLVARLAPVSDFLAVGDEIWGAEDPLAAFRALLAPLG